MPRDMHRWSGKPLSAPPVPPAASPQLVPPVASGEKGSPPPAVACPRCSGEVRLLASGALGCTACAAIFQAQASVAPVRIEAPAEQALDQIDAINAMLRRNTLVLGPGGVPLAESRTESRGNRRAAQRRTRR